MNLDLAAISFARLSLDQIQRFTPRHERNYAMVMCLKTLSEFAHRCPIAVRIPLDMQQQQILQRRNAFILSGLLGEPLESPHLVAELGQLFKVFFAECAGSFFHGGKSPVTNLHLNYITW